MRQQIRIAALIATAGLCGTAIAQDSVSSNLGGLPGDALNPWSDHCAAYVVDLAPITTSAGHTFGVAPLLKSTQIDPNFFNNLGSTVGISTDVLSDVPFSRASYMQWSTAGAGVSAQNTMGDAVSPTGNASQFAIGWSEFGTTAAGESYNGMIGAIVNYDPSDANRLFVDRRMGAVNSSSDASGDSSQLGGVSVDANGNLYYRADDFNVTGPDPLSGTNIFRTRLADRDCNTQNMISLGGTLDATDFIIQGGDTHSVPNNMPASIAGGNGLYGGPNFNSEYVYGGSLGMTTATTDHFDLTGGRTGDHRGNMGSTIGDPFGFGGVYTYGVYAKDANGDTKAMNVWGVDATGAVVGKKAWDIPASVTDNDDGFVLSYSSFVEFVNYFGSVPFRGGVGNMAVGRDINGNALFAATVSENGFGDDFSNQIIVGRYNPTTGATDYTFAAYIDQFGLFTQDAGKPIYDDMGVEIGQLVNLDAVTGGSPLGPSISAPAFDAAGNIWFIGAVELYDRFMDGGSDFDGALLRAVLDPDTFSYRIELVLENGTRATGPNSGLEYSVDFLGTANAGGGASGGSLWSNNVSASAWNGVDISATEPGDEISNGGVIINTSITYDIDGDGIFNDPTSGNFNADAPADESYSVALYVGYYQDGPPPCPADLNGDEVLNFFDVSAFISAFSGMQPDGDFNGDGLFNFFDVSAFISAFSAGCP
ncbi:MAG: hypothetical protein CMJ35_15500 [Phycisphaerae bacterium]|nr:hypothetical protein [Phycisphaerae bacterium]MBM92993.1 hypothetical protein [Phycisphaerae bacterium]